MPNLKDKVALITGASSGIGSSTAIHFASLGCKIAITGRNEKKLYSVQDQCSKEGLNISHILVVPGDLTDDDVAQNILRKTVDYFGCLDILVNNAGLFRRTAVEDESMSQFDLIMQTNFRSQYRMIQLAAPHLIKTKGNIVNVSSIAAFRTFNSGIAYCASKAALDQMVRNVAMQLGPNQVRVNCVNPGIVETEILTNAGASSEFHQGFYQKTKSKIVLGRVGYPEEVAKPIAFLASDEASFITGTTLVVDGGMSVYQPPE